MSSVDVFLKNTSAVLPNSSRDTKRSKLFRYFRPDYLTALMSGQKSVLWAAVFFCFIEL